MAMRAICLPFLILLASPSAGLAQGASGGAAAAYKYALRCFVATGKQDERGAKVSFDAALRLGGAQGFSNRKINEDFADTMATENIKIARSDAYRRQLLSECRKLGMASS